MQSSDLSATPNDWRVPRYSAAVIATVAFMFVQGVVAIVVGAAGWLAGEPAVARYGLGYALLVVLVGVFGIVSRRNIDRVSDVRTAGGATEIRQSSAVWVLIVSMMTCLAALALGAAMEIALHQSGFPGASVVLGVFGIAVATMPMLVVARRLRRGWVRLTPSGITHRGWAFESSLGWEGVAGAKPAFNGYRMLLVIGYANADWPHRYTAPFWRIDKLPPVPMIELDCRKFDVDEVALAQLVDFYASYPDTRGELGTEAAIARFRDRAYG
ncbi:hypothetical protein [Rhodococcus gannanensis]|uniref:PH domain-containing protein n=1 Tax=Rhodococcus gannanensis TaxID=1960308 RepID=A0ABW4P1L4_9NOCA